MIPVFVYMDKLRHACNTAREISDIYDKESRRLHKMVTVYEMTAFQLEKLANELDSELDAIEKKGDK